MKKDRVSSHHPRNRHQGHYDFDRLIEVCPKLAPFVVINQYHNQSIDFADPEAVRALNLALLAHFYGLKTWEIPARYLCPPVPGRADYVHLVADLLGEGAKIPRGKQIRVLDVGVGANCIYPIIGHCEYGWSFVGSDVDVVAIDSAKKIVRANPDVLKHIEFRVQANAAKVLEGIVDVGLPSEQGQFDLVVCNPPFHSSMADAKAGSERKTKNLGKAKGLNFGGQPTELCYSGGEVAFVCQLINESQSVANQVFWFTTLISKETNLPSIYRALDKAETFEYRTLEMAQGQKKSRIVAWTFLGETLQAQWRTRRWA